MAEARILIVEDNDGDVYFLRRALERMGEDFILEIISDGEQALHFIASQRTTQQEKQPCVIVLDLHLPKHNGLEILHALRKDPVLGHVHVVVTTTIASPREEAKLREMGADFRAKPKHLSEFEAFALHLIECCKDLRAAA
jgi:two-component system response regulator